MVRSTTEFSSICFVRICANRVATRRTLQSVRSATGRTCRPRPRYILSRTRTVSARKVSDFLTGISESCCMLLRVKALIRHAMASLFPKTEKWPGVAETGLHDFVERFLREAPFMVRLGLYLGSSVFALAPLITIGVPLPSFLLPGKMRDRYAAKVATHPVYLIRQAVFVVRNCCDRVL